MYTYVSADPNGPTTLLVDIRPYDYSMQDSIAAAST